MLARGIAELVPMARVLEELGIRVNTRTHRAPCVLHGGKNPGAFSWKETGVWHCFRCNQGGDRIALVMAVKKCDFKVALQFIAVLAGISLDSSPSFRSQLAKERRERKQRELKQKKLEALVDSSFRSAQSNIQQLEKLRRNASHRLRQLQRGDRERFTGETEAAWSALALVADRMPNTAAAFMVTAFADFGTRLMFAMSRESHARHINDCLELGGVADDNGKFFGIAF